MRICWKIFKYYSPSVEEIMEGMRERKRESERCEGMEEVKRKGGGMKREWGMEGKEKERRSGC